MASLAVVTELILARHGETDWNLERRVQGHTDRPLNETGRAQARKLADALADERVDAIYSSDLARAYETALEVAARKRLAVHALPELRERSFGTWEGLTDEEVLDRFPEARTGPWGDGETSEELSQRVLAALRKIAVDHPDGSVLVVTHGGPLRAVLRHCEVVADAPIANCHIARFGFRAGALRPID